MNINKDNGLQKSTMDCFNYLPNLAIINVLPTAVTNLHPEPLINQLYSVDNLYDMQLDLCAYRMRIFQIQV